MLEPVRVKHLRFLNLKCPACPTDVGVCAREDLVCGYCRYLYWSNGQLTMTFLSNFLKAGYGQDCDRCLKKQPSVARFAKTKHTETGN